MIHWFNWITPNQLTLSRILAIPAVLYLLWLNEPVANNISWAVFAFACLTDYWDGLLARARGEVSKLGKLLDPVADKMLVMSTLVLLVDMDRALSVPTILIMMREFMVTGLRAVAAADGIVIQAERGAKIKTITQMVAAGSLIIWHDPLGLPAAFVGYWGLWLATALTLWTGGSYFWSFWKAGGTQDHPAHPTPASKPAAKKAETKKAAQPAKKAAKGA